MLSRVNRNLFNNLGTRICYNHGLHVPMHRLKPIVFLLSFFLSMFSYILKPYKHVGILRRLIRIFTVCLQNVELKIE